MKNYFTLLFAFLCLLYIITLSTPLFAAGPPAFPTAEGYCMYATGGRGGKFVAVTNQLEDDEGSIPGCYSGKRF